MNPSTNQGKALEKAEVRGSLPGPGGVECEHEGDGHDHQGTRQFDDGRQLAGGVAVGVPRREDGRGVVDRRTGPYPEPLVAHPHKVSECGKDEDGRDVEEEYGGYGVGDVLHYEIGRASCRERV